MKHLVYACDCEIVRDDDRHPGMAVLNTCDGDQILMVPGAEWTDIQIFTALRIANSFYDLGVRAGAREKMNQIKTALEISSPCQS